MDLKMAMAKQLTVLRSYDKLQVIIMLNGDRFEVAGPLTVTELLAHLELDARRIAVEHNQVIVRRASYSETTVRDGDEIEIVNFVGGG
jgi:sulfur carrier protein